MICPFCKHPETQVFNSRPSADEPLINRRRRCVKCGEKFSTVEIVSWRSYDIMDHIGTLKDNITKAFAIFDDSIR